MMRSRRARKEIRDLRESLAEVYDYMCEVEGILGGQIAVRSYLSLPRTVDERVAIGERARALLGRQFTEAEQR